MRLWRRATLAARGALALSLGLPCVSLGQQVTGRVVRPNGEHPVPVRDKWVVLHRIGHDTAGPLDSMRTDARGAYTFRYGRAESDSALYLVSTTHGGVAYFTPALRPGHVRGEAAEIMVFDTTSAQLPIRIQGRHFVVARGKDAADHQVLEVYELSNDSSLTAVASSSGRAVWTAIVPDRARNFRVGQGDVGEGGLVLREGRVHLVAPIAPGLKQLSFRYELPPDAFPLSVPLTEAVGVLEVVADDPGARVSGGGLRERPAIESEGRTFKRFLSQDVPRNAVVRIELSADRGATQGATVALLGALFAAATAGVVALAIVRGRAKPATTRGPVRPRESEVLVRTIAELDMRFETAPAANDTARAAYEAERRVLKEQLREALAREPERA
jgi:hypothetical protein